MSTANITRVRSALRKSLGRLAPEGTTGEVVGWVEILMMAPIALRYDDPSISRYRVRLAQLAAAIAADIERSSGH